MLKVYDGIEFTSLCQEKALKGGSLKLLHLATICRRHWKVAAGPLCFRLM